MPKIPTYTAPVQGLNTGSLAEAAHRIGIAGREAGEDIRRGASELGSGAEQFGEHLGAQIEVPKLAEDRQDRELKSLRYTNTFFNGGTDADGKPVQAADPHDPHIMEKYQAGLDKIWDGYGDDTLTGIGQRTAQAWKIESQQRYLNIGMADAGVASASAIHQSLSDFATKASDIAYADPSQHTAQQKSFSDFVKLQIGTNPYLSPEQRASLQEEVLKQGQKIIATGAARGIAEQGGSDAMRHAIDSGQFDGILSGHELSEAQSYADSQQRASMEAQRAAEAEQRRQQDEQFKGGLASLTAQMMQPDGSLRPVDPAVLVRMSRLPGAARSPGALKSMAELNARLVQDAHDGKTIVTDPRVYADFASRMTLPEGDPHALSFADVNTARAAGQISDRDFRLFHESIEDMQKDPVKKDAYAEFNKQMGAVKGVITKANVLSGMADPAGDQRYAEFLRYERNQFDSHYEKGDWRKWLDDNNPSKDAVRFAPSLDESQAMVQSQKPAYVPPPGSVSANPKRNPGETPDQYLKRIGK